MEKSHFALSLGLVGVIFVMQAGWGGALWPVAHAAPWPLPALIQRLP
ncbi:hypothetical protein [Fuscibacter oryzae]|uniref:Uncharacterized protein n=1 Tax=Fuscibacter oryzae TaxID=2803939 RepID=A0A8J7SXB5_9RHOB|nr:hypothetical protein [Fuscibacter oryzae]MBL4929814.1 hypothetical protein [Fuscibacter oryzae]